MNVNVSVEAQSLLVQETVPYMLMNYVEKFDLRRLLREMINEEELWHSVVDTDVLDESFIIFYRLLLLKCFTAMSTKVHENAMKFIYAVYIIHDIDFHEIYDDKFLFALDDDDHKDEIARMECIPRNFKNVLLNYFNRYTDGLLFRDIDNLFTKGST